MLGGRGTCGMARGTCGSVPGASDHATLAVPGGPFLEELLEKDASGRWSRVFLGRFVSADDTTGTGFRLTLLASDISGDELYGTLEREHGAGTVDVRGRVIRGVRGMDMEETEVAAPCQYKIYVSGDRAGRYEGEWTCGTEQGRLEMAFETLAAGRFRAFGQEPHKSVIKEQGAVSPMSQEESRQLPDEPLSMPQTPDSNKNEDEADAASPHESKDPGAQEKQRTGRDRVPEKNKLKKFKENLL